MNVEPWVYLAASIIAAFISRSAHRQLRPNHGSSLYDHMLTAQEQLMQVNNLIASSQSVQDKAA